MPKRAAQQNDGTVIKKYPNRRLYNTETSTYITLDDLCQMVKSGEEFIVQDARTGEDLTRQILTQIIFEQETKGANVLPTDFLRNVIRFYDDTMREPMQQFLNGSMTYFTQNQDKMQGYFGKINKGADSFAPMQQFEEMARQNVAMFEKAMSMFNPFMAGGPGGNPRKDGKR